MINTKKRKSADQYQAITSVRRSILSDEELIKLLKRHPDQIHDFPEVSEAVQLAFAHKHPMHAVFLKKPSEAVRIAALKREPYLLADFKNPTEAEQVAAVTKNGQVLYKIDNPCRKAALVALKTYGRNYLYLHLQQDKHGKSFIASTEPLVADLEMQVATLSNITGLTVLEENPHLFNMSALSKVYPKVAEVATTWLALGFGYHNAEDIKVQFKQAKLRVKKVETGVEVILPTNLEL